MATRSRVTLKEATDTVAGITVAWSPQAVKRLATVAKFSDLPAAVQDDVRNAGGNERIRGEFHKRSDMVYVVAGNHSTLADVEETVFHEAYGHLGLAGLFDKDIKTKMNQLWLAIGGDKGIREAAKRNGINLEGYFQDAAAGVVEGKLSQEGRNQVMMEELLSHLAQDQRPTIKKRIQELMGAFRQWLRASGFPLLGKLSDGELFILLRRAKDAIHTNRFDKSFYIDSEPMFRTEQTRAGYERRIDELFGGAKPDRQGVTVLDSSDVLDLLGYGGLPVVLHESHAIGDGKFNHPLTADQWKCIPGYLDNPVAVFERSDGNMTFVTEELVDGKPLVIGVAPRSAPVGGRGKESRHLLLTAFVRDRGVLPVAKMIRDGELRYVDTRKSPEFNASSGLQIPSSGVDLRGLGRKIHTGADLFKYRKERGISMLRQGDYPFPTFCSAPSA